MDRINSGLRVGASGAVTSTAVRTVLAQRVTGGEAIRSWNGVLRRWGSPAPGPGESIGLRVHRRPVIFATCRMRPSTRSASNGVAPRRSAPSARIRRGLDSWAELPLSEAWAEAARVLPMIRGVGPWTESVVRGSVLGDPDAVVVGDLHIPHEVCHKLEGTDRGSDERMLELLAPYAGHRGRAQRLVLRAPGRAPRRAPRYVPLPIAAHVVPRSEPTKAKPSRRRPTEAIENWCLCPQAGHRKITTLRASSSPQADRRTTESWATR